MPDRVSRHIVWPAARGSLFAAPWILRLLAGLLILIFVAVPETAGARIKKDQVVIFFNTFGYFSQEEGVWIVRIHGWIFEPEMGSKVRSEILKRLRRALAIDEDAARSAVFNQRARPFLVDSKRAKKIAVRLGERVYNLKRSGPNGHCRGTVRLTTDEVRRLRRTGRVKNDWLPFHALTDPSDKRTFTGSVQLVDQTGISVISDIDDTIRDSQSRDRLLLLHNTFLREFRAIPGMVDLYRNWARQSATFHYVSAAPWPLYEPLADFIRAKGFPAGSFHLQDFRWRYSSFRRLFDSPDVTKRKLIEPILKTFPRRRFVLVGDSAQKDPELYGSLARKYPDQVVHIFLRNVTNENKQDDRFKRAFEGMPHDRWRLFRHAREISDIKLSLTPAP